MSRIGKAPIAIPAGVTVQVKDHVVTVKGKNGSLEQKINPDITVGQAVKDAEKLAGAAIEVTGMARLLLGEGVEKEESDFAAEVAAAVKK